MTGTVTDLATGAGLAAATVTLPVDPVPAETRTLADGSFVLEIDLDRTLPVFVLLSATREGHSTDWEQLDTRELADTPVGLDFEVQPCGVPVAGITLACTP